MNALFYVLFCGFLFFATCHFRPVSSKHPKTPKKAPESSRELPRTPQGPPSELSKRQMPVGIVFRVCVICSFVFFLYCTSDTGSRMVNGQNGGPSARWESTFGRRFAQMAIGFLIFRVFLPPLSFFNVLHCRHRSTPGIWPPKGSRAAPRRVPDCPNSS